MTREKAFAWAMRGFGHQCNWCGVWNDIKRLAECNGCSIEVLRCATVNDFQRIVNEGGKRGHEARNAS